MVPEKPDSHDLRDASRGTRIQKVLAAAGVGPRRMCEELVESGQVTVNGRLVTELPAWVDPARDRITVAGKRVRCAAPLVYTLLYKPRGVVSTNADPEGRTRAIDLVEHPSRVRLFPVGRLDTNSTGLLLLTNDGALANQLTHPRYHMPKVYEVSVRGAIGNEAMGKLEKGLMLSTRRRDAARRTSRSRLRIIKRDRDRTKLLMELREGRNRQIRRMMSQLGHPVQKLRRVQMGPIKLGGLRPGQWRELTPDELHALQKVARRREARDARAR